MKDNTRSWILRRAIAVALLLTAVMALCGTVANLVRPLSWLRHVAQVIAFPPSLIVRHLIAINGSSLFGVIAVEIEGVVLTLVFYSLLAAFVLWLMVRRSDTGDTPRKRRR